MSYLIELDPFIIGIKDYEGKTGIDYALEINSKSEEIKKIFSKKTKYITKLKIIGSKKCGKTKLLNIFNKNNIVDNTLDTISKYKEKKNDEIYKFLFFDLKKKDGKTNKKF
jgi:hypothetical protein